MTNTERIDWEAKYNELLEKYETLTKEQQELQQLATEYEFLKSMFDELARLCDSMIESKGE